MEKILNNKNSNNNSNLKNKTFKNNEEDILNKKRNRAISNDPTNKNILKKGKEKFFLFVESFLFSYKK